MNGAPNVDPNSLCGPGEGPPHIKNFRVGSEMGGILNAFLYVDVLSFSLLIAQGTTTMLLVNHAYARVPPTIFVIFGVFTGSEQQSPCLAGYNVNSSFSSFSSQPSLWQWTRARFTKATPIG